MTAPWNKLFDHIQSGHKCCSAKNLVNQSGKDIYVMKICNVETIGKFYEENKGSLVDNIHLDPDTKFVISVIPSTTTPLVSLFCCNNTMRDIYDKISSHGIAIEGCYITKSTNGQILPLGLYSGLTKSEKLIHSETDDNRLTAGYLVIDDYNKIYFLNKAELISFKPSGINIQFIRGIQLFKNGKSVIDFSTMKNIKYGGKSIDGSNVVLDYTKKEIIIENQVHSFDEILDGKIILSNPPFFTLSGRVVVARDAQNNIIIIVHPKIDFFTLQLLLDTLGAKDALMLCEADDSCVIWKEAGLNRFNHTDFIGKMNEVVNNVIVFSS